MRQYEREENPSKLTARCVLALSDFLGVLASTPRSWSSSPHVIAISIVGGKPNGSVLTLSGGRTPVLCLRQGKFVELRWSSDRRMDLHLRGYNLEVQATPGADNVMSFTARFVGRFPVETHDEQGRHRVVLYIEVHPQ
jgi:hypothetical protein